MTWHLIVSVVWLFALGFAAGITHGDTHLIADINVLLFVGILGVAFTAYEIAGLTLPGWHTISWFAHEHVWLRWAISGGFLLIGAMLAIWFPFHAAAPVPR